MYCTFLPSSRTFCFLVPLRTWVMVGLGVGLELGLTSGLGLGLVLASELRFGLG